MLNLKGTTIVLLVVLIQFFSSPAPAQNQMDFSREAPLTQADIDAYIFLAPRLLGDMNNHPDQAAKLLDEVKITPQRAVYLMTKIPVAQALARGLVSPSRLDEKLPDSLRPTTEEVKLVNDNLHNLMQAENEAIGSSGVQVPRKGLPEAPEQ